MGRWISIVALAATTTTGCHLLLPTTVPASLDSSTDSGVDVGVHDLVPIDATVSDATGTDASTASDPAIHPDCERNPGVAFCWMRPIQHGHNLSAGALIGNELIAVGRLGAVLRFDGTNWDALPPPPTTEMLRAVVKSTGGFIVGGAQRILLEFDGSNWLKLHHDPASTFGVRRLLNGPGDDLVVLESTREPSEDSRVAYWDAATRTLNSLLLTDVGTGMVSAILPTLPGATSEFLVGTDNPTISFCMLIAGGLTCSPMSLPSSATTCSACGVESIHHIGNQTIAVLTNGEVLRRSGQSWSTVASVPDLCGTMVVDSIATDTSIFVICSGNPQVLRGVEINGSGDDIEPSGHAFYRWLPDPGTVATPLVIAPGGLVYDFQDAAGSLAEAAASRRDLHAIAGDSAHQIAVGDLLVQVRALPGLNWDRDETLPVHPWQHVGSVGGTAILVVQPCEHWSYTFGAPAIGFNPWSGCGLAPAAEVRAMTTVPHAAKVVAGGIAVGATVNPKIVVDSFQVGGWSPTSLSDSLEFSGMVSIAGDPADRFAVVGGPSQDVVAVFETGVWKKISAAENDFTGSPSPPGGGEFVDITAEYTNQTVTAFWVVGLASKGKPLIGRYAPGQGGQWIWQWFDSNVASPIPTGGSNNILRHQLRIVATADVTSGPNAGRVTYAIGDPDTVTPQSTNPKTTLFRFDGSVWDTVSARLPYIRDMHIDTATGHLILVGDDGAIIRYNPGGIP